MRASKLTACLLDLVFPPGCPACGELGSWEAEFCPSCQAGIQELPPFQCRLCGVGLESGPPLCPACRQRRPHFDRARAVALYQGPLADTVRAFKYHRRWAAGRPLARFLAGRVGPEALEGLDLAAPVPLHRWRMLKRGFNQSQVLARELAQRHGLLLAPDLLARVRHTRPQVGLDGRSRRANVAGAFAVKPQRLSLVDGARVLLVDDVFTTGATVDECARMLKQAGARRVEVLTLARV